MTRWLAFFLLLIPCSGCMMIEDLLFFDDAPPGAHRHHATAEPPHGTCNLPGPSIAASQTAEPELLQIRK
jgi:hypothetical protein